MWDMGFGDARRRLFDTMVCFAYQKRKVTLSSGRESDFYIDCKAVTWRTPAILEVGYLVNKLLSRGPPVIAVGGLTLGADSIAIATTIESVRRGPVTYQPFSVRKEPKPHGTQRWIEGNVQGPGQAVAILEDVITTGASAIKAIERCREAGLVPVRVVALVDRQEDDGVENIRRALNSTSTPYSHPSNIESLFTREDFERGSLKRSASSADRAYL